MTSPVGRPDATMVLTAHLAGLSEATEDDAGGTTALFVGTPAPV